MKKIGRIFLVLFFLLVIVLIFYFLNSKFSIMGRAVSYVSSGNCVDSDNGFNITGKGVCSVYYSKSNKAYSYPDYCESNGIVLNERYCMRGNCIIKKVPCPYGCKNDACVSKEIITPPTAQPITTTTSTPSPTSTTTTQTTGITSSAIASVGKADKKILAEFLIEIVDSGDYPLKVSLDSLIIGEFSFPDSEFGENELLIRTFYKNGSMNEEKKAGFDFYLPGTALIMPLTSSIVSFDYFNNLKYIKAYIDGEEKFSGDISNFVCNNNGVCEENEDFSLCPGDCKLDCSANQILSSCKDLGYISGTIACNQVKTCNPYPGCKCYDKSCFQSNCKGVIKPSICSLKYKLDNKCSLCGNGFCDSDENLQICQQDCRIQTTTSITPTQPTTPTTPPTTSPTTTPTTPTITPTPACIPSWQCSSWSSCLNNQQTRTCNDLNNCKTALTQTQPCTITPPTSTPAQPITIDNPPKIKIIKPLTTSFKTSDSLEFSCNITDDIQVKTLGIIIQNSSSYDFSMNNRVVYMNTKLVSGTFNKTSWMLQANFLSPGRHMWYCYGTDTSNKYSYANFMYINVS